MITESQFNSSKIFMSYICGATDASLFGGLLFPGCYINIFTHSPCSETEI